MIGFVVCLFGRLLYDLLYLLYLDVVLGVVWLVVVWGLLLGFALRVVCVAGCLFDVGVWLCVWFGYVVVLFCCGIAERFAWWVFGFGDLFW